MSYIIKAWRGNQAFYYLEHSIRDGKKVYKKRKYLGKGVPKNISVLKERLADEVYMEKWYPRLEKIKKQYKSEIAKTPKTVLEKNLEAFAIRFTYDTQRIEGSKLSLKDTERILAEGIVPRNAKIDDVKEAEEHRKVFYMMLAFKEKLTLDVVLGWHRLLFSQTKPDVAGKIRTYKVLIGTSNFIPPHPERLDDLLSDFFGWLGRAGNSTNPVKLAALVHLKFVTIHPFGDGNGRISRLMMNFILNRYGYPMIDIKYTGRLGYYNALQRAQVHKDEYIFLDWFFRRYIEENSA